MVENPFQVLRHPDFASQLYLRFKKINLPEQFQISNVEIQSVCESYDQELECQQIVDAISNAHHSICVDLDEIIPACIKISPTVVTFRESPVIAFLIKFDGDIAKFCFVYPTEQINWEKTASFTYHNCEECLVHSLSTQVQLEGYFEIHEISIDPEIKF